MAKTPEKRVRDRTREFYRQTLGDPNVNDATSLEFYDPRQRLNWGTKLAIELACNPTRTHIVNALKVKKVADVLVATRLDTRERVLVMVAEAALTRADVSEFVSLPEQSRSLERGRQKR